MEFSVKVPSEAVVPLTVFPLASTRVTAAPLIAAPSDAVPVTLAVTLMVEQLSWLSVLNAVVPAVPVNHTW